MRQATVTSDRVGGLRVRQNRKQVAVEKSKNSAGSELAFEVDGIGQMRVFRSSRCQ